MSCRSLSVWRGTAALPPFGRLAAGRFIAAVLRTTGYLYGHLFFTPNDIPFLAAMTQATLAIVATSKRAIRLGRRPSRPGS
jgi:hypothetical protein